MIGAHNTAVLLPRQRVLRVLMRYMEVAGAIASLFVLSRGVIPLLLHGQDVSNSSDSPLLIERIPTWCFYAFTAAQVVLRPWRVMKYALTVPLPVAMVLLASLSVLWSLDPSETLHRTFSLAMTTIFGIYLAVSFSRRHLLYIVASVLGAAAISSLAFGLLLPSYGIAVGTLVGDWQGVFTHKNTLGSMMLFAAVVFKSISDRSFVSRVGSYLGVFLAVVLVILSRSITALIVLGAISLIMPLLRRLRERRLRAALAVTSIATSCALVLLLTLGRDTLLGLTGKDTTLTGRTGIWSAVIDRVVERPWLGHGYGAFWSTAAGPGERVRREIQWNTARGYTPRSHNGFLDFGADLGLIGVMILIGIFAHGGRRMWKAWQPELGASGDWFIALLLSILLLNITESYIYQSLFAWSLLVATAASQPNSGFDSSTAGEVAAGHKGRYVTATGDLQLT